MTQQEQMRTVYEWIVEAHGEEAGYNWLWACTPFPCGTASDGMLQEGLAVATGELTLNELMAKVESEMEEQMAAYEKSREASDGAR